MGLIDPCQETSKAPYDVPKVRLTSVVSSKNEVKSGLSGTKQTAPIKYCIGTCDLSLTLYQALKYVRNLLCHSNLVNLPKKEVNWAS